MTAYVIGACCKAARKAGHGGAFAEPAGPDGGALVGSLIADDTPLRPYEPEPRNRGVALHEAAHAVVGLILGLDLRGAQIDVPAQVTFDFAKAFVRGALVQMVLSGTHAQNRGLNAEVRMTDAAWLFFVEAVRSGDGGRCDHCVAARTVLRAQVDMPNGAAIRHLRHQEGEVLATLRKAHVWRAICDVAGRLMDVGRVGGDEVREIAARHGLRASEISDRGEAA